MFRLQVERRVRTAESERPASGRKQIPQDVVLHIARGSVTADADA